MALYNQRLKVFNQAAGKAAATMSTVIGAVAVNAGWGVAENAFGYYDKFYQTALLAAMMNSNVPDPHDPNGQIPSDERMEMALVALQAAAELAAPVCAAIASRKGWTDVDMINGIFVSFIDSVMARMEAGSKA